MKISTPAVQISSFESRIRRYYWIRALWKSAVFGAIGAAFVSGGITPVRAAFGAVVVLVIAFVTEYLWLYKPDMRRHNELLRQHGDDYERRLRTAIEEQGLSKLVNGLWFARCHDEYKKKE